MVRRVRVRAARPRRRAAAHAATGRTAAAPPRRRLSASASTVGKSLCASSGNAANSAVASEATAPAWPSLGFMMATRQTSIAATIPGVVSRGIRPARASDDFPEPLAPTISRNGVPRSPLPRDVAGLRR